LLLYGLFALATGFSASAATITNSFYSRFTGTNAAALASMDSLDDKHKLGLGDRVTFRVLEDRDEPKPLQVTDSGELEVPYLGRVAAMDKTCRQLAQEIKTQLEKDLYYSATVIIGVDVLNRNRGKVYIVGQVKTPGAIEIPSDDVFTLSKAVLGAGGFGDFADKKRVKLTRQSTNKEEEAKVFIVDVSEIWEKGKTDKDVKLQPGDLIFVPAKLVNF
jgi:polysaccharide export outer membrane protein